MSLGVNFFGPIYSEDGIGEATRLALDVFRKAGVDVALNPLSRPVAREEQSCALKNLSMPHNVNYFQFSSRWVPYYFEQLGVQNFKNSYNIGYWFTEVRDYPLDWAENHAGFHEIWTSSSFCQDSISMTLPIPTLLIPLPIVGNKIQSSSIDVPETKSFSGFVFLVMANMYSDIERKNVLCSLEAFKRAFDPGEDVTLVLKLSNSDVDPTYCSKIEEYIEADSRIVLVDRFIDRNQVNILYQSVDAYVSLHRVEGFGLTIGEAMFHEIPVIATAYSGNMDFCNCWNSYLVDYDLVEVGADRLRYKASDVWAEPKLDSAIEAFQEVYKDPVKRLSKVQAAKRLVEKQFSVEAVAKKVRKRLELIDAKFNYSSLKGLYA